MKGVIKIPRRKTNEEFLEDVKRCRPNDYMDYEFLEEYVNSQTKIKVRHKCGNSYSVTPCHFLNNRSCPQCCKNHKKTHKEFLQEFKEKYPDTYSDYDFLSEYRGANIKIKIRHCCGLEYSTSPSNLLQGSGCKKCLANRLRKTDEEFKKELFNSLGKDYTSLTPYRSNKIKVKCRHICGLEWDVLPNNLLKHGCPKCHRKRGDKKRSLTTEEFKNKVRELKKDEYRVEGEYINNHTKIKMFHSVCGKAFYIRPDHFLHYGVGCPSCSSPLNSKGIQKIKKYLESHNIKYITEKTYPNLKSKKGRALRFDIAVLDNNKTEYLIEFDHRQHYEVVDFFGSEEGFRQTQERDRIKNDYCKIHNIPLLRIRYNEEKDIDNILHNFIHNLNKEINESEVG